MVNQEDANFGPGSPGTIRPEPLRFTGHERDFDTSWAPEYLDYMHARYYDPLGGRFLSVDPVLGNLREPQGWNRYAYVQNSPTNFVDPYGLKAMPSSGSKKPGWCKTQECEEVVAPTDAEAAEREARARARVERMMLELALQSLRSRYTGTIRRVWNGDVDYLSVNVSIGLPKTRGLGGVGGF